MLFRSANIVFPFSAARMGSISSIQLLEGLTKVTLAVVLESLIGVEGIPGASIIAMGLFSVWYVPRFTLRWLDLPIPEEIIRGATIFVPVALATGAAAWFGWQAFSKDTFGALAVGTVITGAGFAMGAAISLFARRRVVRPG